MKAADLPLWRSLSRQNIWRKFQQSIFYLMPYIESRFHTYAEETTEEGFKASRGGRYYPVETVDYLENMLAEGGYGEEDFRIYQGIGTDDPIWDQTDGQIQEMFTRSTFTPENLHYAIIEGGRHDIDACERYLYYALQDFFGGEE